MIQLILYRLFFLDGHIAVTEIITVISFTSNYAEFFKNPVLSYGK